MEHNKFVTFFIRSAGVLLLITALAKLASTVGGARILEYPTPILIIPYRQFFWIAGLLELAIAVTCFLKVPLRLKTGLIAWLGTMFFIYRLGLYWIGFPKPCPCLGNLTDILHIPPAIATMSLKVILTYLVLGSYLILSALWLGSKRGQHLSTPSLEGN